MFKAQLGFVKKNDGSEADKILNDYEHRRWSAYMRSEGFSKGGVRDDIAKTHPDLIPTGELDPVEYNKDGHVLSRK